MMNNLIRGMVVLLMVISLFACSKGSGENERVDAGLNNNINNEAENNVNEPDEEIDDNINESEEENNGDELGDSSFVIDVFSDDSETVLVNKFNSLSDYFAPEDLVTVRVPTILENPEVNQLRQVAADALYDMFEEAKDSGVILYARSGYRSYETQIYLFNGYVEKHGEEAANKFSAKPWFSEHQTGLVMDVTSESVGYQLTPDFGDTKEGVWLKENAHKFGFVIRYPEGKEDITGYVYEPWHIRYLGVDLATAVYESGLSYEEFLVEEGIIHAVNANAKE